MRNANKKENFLFPPVIISIFPRRKIFFPSGEFMYKGLEHMFQALVQ